MFRWLVLASALFLGGCFSSEGPVFAEARGDCPFAAPANYREIDDGVTDVFIFASDGAYCSITNARGEVDRALFVPIGRNWWIVQGEEDRPSYALMHRTGDRLVQYHPRCEEFSAARLRRLGVAFDEERQNCTVSEARQIETLFRSWRSPFRMASGAYRREPG